MADDGADEEAVVRHFRALLHFGGAQVQVHLVVGAGHGGQVKAAHAAELQLEGQGGLQMTVNAIFRELRAGQRAKADRQIHRHRMGHWGRVPAWATPCLADPWCSRR